MLEFLAAALIAGFSMLALIGHAALFQALFFPARLPFAADLPGATQHG